MKSRIALLAVLMILATLLLAVWPAMAQDLSDDEQEILDIVTTAVDNFDALESYSLEGEIVTSQVIGAMGMSLTNDITQVMSGQYSVDEDDNTRAYFTLNQETNSDMGTGLVSVNQVLEMAVYEGDFWVRVTDSSGDITGITYPEGWVNVSEDPAAIPGMELLNPEVLVASFSSAMQYPLTEDSVASISELESEEDEDGQTVRVFTVEMNVDFLNESGALSDLMGSMMNLEQLGPGVDDLISGMFEGMQIKLTLGVGEDDGLIHTVASDVLVDAEGLQFQGVTMDLAQTTSVSATYSDFNESLDIPVPVEGE